jgi:RimJ/RimL family protein N-acetyltransferase
MYVESDRLIIRSFTPADIEALIEMSTDDGFGVIFGDDTNYVEWLGDWVMETIELDKENNHLQDYLAYVITDKVNQKVIGTIGCSYYEDIDKIGIAYFIREEFRMKGFASEASNAYADFFIDTYDVDELIATVKTENNSSRRVIEKSGFSFVETRMYQDIHDDKPEKYDFFIFTKS